MDRNRGGRPRYPDVLTPAEWRVLKALRDGGTNAGIAARLGLSPDTVKYHISNMLAKLELRDRRALAAWRPDGARGRLGALLAVWSAVGRPLAWVGVGTAAAAGVAAAVVAAVGVVVVVVVIVAGGGDLPALVKPSVPSCSSGIAVTNPDANAELVADCEALLGLRDTIRGTGKLNWTAGKPMSEWMGVTVSGTPQRVTSLNLANLSLNGKVSGLLGELTGLTELRLNGNTLTGMLPSKLVQLTSLTTVALSGTDFDGCAPPVLREAATNDVAGTGLDDCGEAPFLSMTEPVIPSGTYYFGDPAPVFPGGLSPTVGDTPIVFDIPEGLSISGEHVTIVHSDFLGPPPPGVGQEGLTLENPEQGFRFWIDLEYGGVSDRYIYETMSAAEQEALDALIDLVGESTWFKPE